MGRYPLTALLLAAAMPLRAGFYEAERLSGQAFFEALPTLKDLRPGAVPPLPPSRPGGRPASSVMDRDVPPDSQGGGRPQAKGRPDIHSALDFSNVTWPADLTEDDKTAFEVALNISGSFEGDDAWSNITGNFDGQGLSLGLLNQNLGQGSLQPLLLKMNRRHPEKLVALFTPEHLKSLLGMLGQWEAPEGAAFHAQPLSILDEASSFDALDGASRNQESVTWAKDSLYDGQHFEAVWKAELTAMAADPDYVSLQIEAALGYHLKAAAYEAQIGVREFRSYLFLFDIVVQNGGIYPEDFADYAAYLKAAPKATNTQRLEKLLELRLRHVRKRFVADVRARKSAIITGKGLVHGEKRDLPKQYNYDPLWVYR